MFKTQVRAMISTLEDETGKKHNFFFFGGGGGDGGNFFFFDQCGGGYFLFLGGWVWGIQFLLAHLSRRLIGELIVYPWSGVRRTSSSVRPSVHNAQTSSSRKPLGRSKPNFMWSLLG